VASGFAVSTGAAAAIVTATQLGYAAGIFPLLPLGDRVAARRLILTLLGLVTASLLAAGAAPTLELLVAASVLVGLTTVLAQTISTLAAGMVAAERRGLVAGTLLSGSIGGILLARTFGGVLGERLGWQAPYLAAAAGCAVDRLGPDHVNTMALVGSIAATPVLAAASLGGAAGLVALVAATLQLDVAMQCGMVANVARFYAVRPEACNRMSSAYMTCAYLGGSAGSLLGTIAYSAVGWHGATALMALAPAPAPALVLHLRRVAARPLRGGEDALRAAG
jgi:predicted MFS family arabinose efflux permease